MGLIFTKICYQETELKECNECNELQEIIYNKMDIIKDLNYAREQQYNYILTLEKQINQYFDDDI
jgi:hypothetical protein